MKSLAPQVTALWKDAKEKVAQLIELYGGQSQHQSDTELVTVLEVKGGNSQVVLEGARYLVEISSTHFIDDDGNLWEFTTIPLDDFCHILDNQETQYTKS